MSQPSVKGQPTIKSQPSMQHYICYKTSCGNDSALVKHQSNHRKLTGLNQLDWPKLHVRTQNSYLYLMRLDWCLIDEWLIPHQLDMKTTRTWRHLTDLAMDISAQSDKTTTTTYRHNQHLWRNPWGPASPQGFQRVPLTGDHLLIH